ncbi:MAG TPA: bifunctional phosphopantothenoylcysteine decarboxylase/phosphopantothenate--cysteine ligase CoaBC [Vicinamibacterales bacterium]|nr:bifunctional phosphopantothenoylcysteine decarboxylase/phosphopantothenate--cysteine ligase CoaBC [Vicinamibacterales bacterium]
MALIALGVTGGIGAYKAVEIARGLQKNGHDVIAVMTRSARKFVGPLTFEAITRHEVITDQWKAGANADIEHIAIASNIDLLLVAPATANTIAKFANGLADDFLSSLYTATRAPVMIAPAMNSNMFDHPAVAKNLETLIAHGVHVVDPGSGYLACGWIGKGRLAEPQDVVNAAEQLLKSKSSAALAGRSILITAGPTFEDIDPVRFVGNRSSGRMGYALAAEALRRGAAVTLVTGPTHLSAPHGANVVKARSAADMHAAVMERTNGQDAIIMSAAVADYSPAEPANKKMKKGDGPVTITLNRTRDILGELGKLPSRKQGVPVLVGFAAETNDVITYAKSKLKEKAADLIVANDVSRSDAGFDVDTNAVTLVSASSSEDIPLQSKSAIAGRILDRIEQLLIAVPNKNAAAKA